MTDYIVYSKCGQPALKNNAKRIFRNKKGRREGGLLNAAEIAISHDGKVKSHWT